MGLAIGRPAQTSTSAAGRPICPVSAEDELPANAGIVWVLIALTTLARLSCRGSIGPTVEGRPLPDSRFGLACLIEANFRSPPIADTEKVCLASARQSPRIAHCRRPAVRLEELDLCAHEDDPVSWRTSVTTPFISCRDDRRAIRILRQAGLHEIEGFPSSPLAGRMRKAGLPIPILPGQGGTFRPLARHLRLATARFVPRSPGRG